MSEVMEMYEGIEESVKELLAYYNNLKTYTDCEEYRREGAISALERLLEMWNED